MDTLLLKLFSIILSFLMSVNSIFPFIVPEKPVENAAEICNSELIETEEKDGSFALISDYVSWYQAVDKDSGLPKKYDWKFFFNANLALVTVELPNPGYSIEIDSVSEEGETLELSYTVTENEGEFGQISCFKIIIVETTKNITDVSVTKNIVNLEKGYETSEITGYKYFICEENNFGNILSHTIFHSAESFENTLADSAEGFSKYNAKYFEEKSLAVARIYFPEDGYTFRPVEIQKKDMKIYNSKGELLEIQQNLKISGWKENANSSYKKGNCYLVVECSKDIDKITLDNIGLGSKSVIFDYEMFKNLKLADGQSEIIYDYETWSSITDSYYFSEYGGINEKYFEEKSLALTAVLIPGESTSLKVNSVNQKNALVEIDCTMTANYDPDYHTLTCCKIIAVEASKETFDVKLTVNNDEIVFDRYALGLFNLTADDSPLLVSDHETWTNLVNVQSTRFEKYDESYFKNKSLIVIPETFNNGAIEPELIKYFKTENNLEIIYGLNMFHDMGASVIIDDAIIFEVNGKVQNISVERKDLRCDYKTYTNYNLCMSEPTVISDYEEWAKLVDVTDEKYSKYNEKYFKNQSVVLFTAMLPDSGASPIIKYAYEDGNTLEVGYSTYSLGGFTMICYQAVLVETDKTVTDVNVVKLK